MALFSGLSEGEQDNPAARQVADLLGKLLVVLFENTTHVEIKSTGIAYEIVNLYVIVTGRAELIRLGNNASVLSRS